MGTFYCPQCASLKGFPSAIIPPNLTGTTYQLEKFIKHHSPTANYGVNSIFDDPNSYGSYANSASAYGFYEKDGKGRLNIILDVKARIGETRSMHQSAAIPNSAIKFVNCSNPQTIHGFPTGLSSNIVCACCGCVIK